MKDEFFCSSLRSHEKETLRLLVEAGYSLEVIIRSEKHKVHTPDIMLNGEEWEIKSPHTDNLKALERNLKRARSQSVNIILDCRRMKKIPNVVIEREVRSCFRRIRGICKIKLIVKSGRIIDICK